MNEKFENELETLRSVYDEILHISDSLHKNLKERSQYVRENLRTVPLMYKIARKHRLIIDLLMKGYYQESKIILRSILEDLYSLIFLKSHPELVDKWVNGEIQLGKIIKKIRKYDKLVNEAYPLYKELSEQVHSQGNSLNLREIPGTQATVVLEMPVILYDEFYDVYINIFNVMMWFFIHINNHYLNYPAYSNIDSAWERIMTQYQDYIS